MRAMVLHAYYDLTAFELHRNQCSLYDAYSLILKYLRYVVKQIFVFCTFRRNAMFVSKCLGMFFAVKLFA